MNTPVSSSAPLHPLPAVGIVPAAGLGSRMQPFAYPKELLPITYEIDPSRQCARPRLLIQYSLDQLKEAGIPRAIIVVAPWKLELVRLLEGTSGSGLSLAFVVREIPRGLGDAIDAGYPWLSGSQVCLTLPDTVVSPPGALGIVRVEQTRSGADVVLGVFPTDNPEQLGPTRVDSSGNVLEIQEKPARTDLCNTWGIAVWSPRFTEFLHETLAGDSENKATLGVVFQRALESGFRVRACSFDEGRYRDLGTPEALAALITEVSAAPRPTDLRKQ